MNAPGPEPAPRDEGKVVDITQSSGDPPVLDPALGLKLARRIQKSANMLRQARQRVESCRADGRRKTLARIDRTYKVIQDLEHDALALGVSTPYDHDVRALLDACDEAVSSVVGRRKALKARHLRGLRREVRDIRRRLEALL